MIFELYQDEIEMDAASRPLVREIPSEVFSWLDFSQSIEAYLIYCAIILAPFFVITLFGDEFMARFQPGRKKIGVALIVLGYLVWGVSLLTWAERIPCIGEKMKELQGDDFDLSECKPKRPEERPVPPKPN